MNAYLAAATALLLGLVPCGVVIVRSHGRFGELHGLAALLLAGPTTTLVLICIAAGEASASYTGVALIAAVLGWVSVLVYARFLGREP